MAQTLKTLVEHYGYLAVFLLVMLEDFGMPTPGETVLVLAAGFAATGDLSIWAVLGLAFVAAVIGDNIGYGIGHFGGRPLVMRYGSRLGLTEKRYEFAEGFFHRYGDAIVVIARFVEILRQLNGIIAGTLEMPWPKFLAFNSLGAALWVGVWGAVGYFAGEHIHQIATWFSRFSWVAALAIAGAIALWWWTRRTGHAQPPAE